MTAWIITVNRFVQTVSSVQNHWNKLTSNMKNVGQNIRKRKLFGIFENQHLFWLITLIVRWRGEINIKRIKVANEGTLGYTKPF